jgi:hypothetical protein
VAARHEQRDERKARRIADRNGDSSALEVMDAGHRPRQRGGERAGHAGADQQRARQSGPAGVRHGVDRAERQAGRIEDLPRQRKHAADVVARGQFRHDAAVSRGACRSGCAAPAPGARRIVASTPTSATPVSSHDDSMPSTFMRGV